MSKLVYLIYMEMQKFIEFQVQVVELSESQFFTQAYFFSLQLL